MWGVVAVVAAPAVITGATAAVTAADTGLGFDPFSLISTAVTPVLVVLLLLAGKLHTDGEVKRLEADLAAKDTTIDTKDEQLSALQSGLVERVIPALTRSTLVLEGLDATRFRRRPPGDG